MISQFTDQMIMTHDRGAQNHEGGDRLTRAFIRASDYRSLCHGWVINQCAFDFGGGDVMARDQHHIIDSPQ